MQIPNNIIWFMYFIFVFAIVGFVFYAWVLPIFQKGDFGLGITFVIIMLNPLAVGIFQRNRNKKEKDPK